MSTLDSSDKIRSDYIYLCLLVELLLPGNIKDCLETE